MDYNLVQGDGQRVQKHLAGCREAQETHFTRNFAIFPERVIMDKERGQAHPFELNTGKTREFGEITKIS